MLELDASLDDVLVSPSEDAMVAPDVVVTAVVDDELVLDSECAGSFRHALAPAKSAMPTSVDRPDATTTTRC